MPIQTNEFENRIGYVFNNKEYLITALTHSSYANESGMPEYQCNERLEFLGDAVLNIIVSRHLYNLKPEMTEGAMTKSKARIVCEPALMRSALEIGLQEHIFLSKGEEMTGGRKKPSVVSGAFEALIGAICIDRGIERAGEFILEKMAGLLSYEIKESISSKYSGSPFVDYKSELQEHVQGIRDISGIRGISGKCVENTGVNGKNICKGNTREIEYKIISETGPDHSKQFIAEASTDGFVLGRGKGKSKKEAEQDAAMHALAEINDKK